MNDSFRDARVPRDVVETIVPSVSLVEVVRQAGGGVVVVDRGRKVTFTNPAALEIARVRLPLPALALREDVWGRASLPDGRAVPVEDWAIVRALGGEVVPSAWSRMVRDDGSFYDIVVTARTLRDPEGRPVGAVATFTEVTFLGRRAAGSTAGDEGRYLSTLENLLEGFQIIDRDWRYAYVNPSAARQGRRRREDLHGRTMMEAYPGIERTPLFARLRRCMDERVSDSFENPFEFPDGTVRHFELRVEPVPEGLCISSRDVQDRKDAEQEMRRLNQELESRVAERTRALEAANRELEAFSYSVSHDLRAPLRSIDGFAQALAEDAYERLLRPEQDHLRRIRAATKRMGLLIDDLLELARVARSPMEVVGVDLTAMAASVLAELRSAEPGRAVATVLAPDVRAEGDPRLLRVVLTNLIGNAWKYTSRTASPRIELRSEVRDGETVYVVEDNGIGFDPAYAERLFGTFQRLHSVEEYPGTGVGLAIVRRIVARHGGRVWAEGRPGRGATFFFTLRPERAGGTD